MTRADLLKEIADHHYALADLYQQLAGESATRTLPDPTVTDTGRPVGGNVTVGEGHLEVCPKHHVPFTAGQYGPYCKQATDDPAWGKQKGDRLWCRITPQNAAEYLRIKAAAA